MEEELHSGASAIRRDASSAATDPPSLLDRLMIIERGVARVEIWTVMVAMAVVILAILFSILIRTFALPFPDTGELAIVAMSPLTFVGGALCTHLHQHLTGDIVEALPEGKLKRGIDAVAAFLTGLFGVFFVILSWDLFAYALSSGETLIDFGTPISLPVGFMLCAAALIVFHSGLDIWRALAGRVPGGIDPWYQ